MHFTLQAAGVFGAVFTLDLVWALYTMALTDRRALAAAGYAAVIISLSGVAAIQYTSNALMLIPAAAGAFAGTAAAIWWRPA